MWLDLARSEPSRRTRYCRDGKKTSFMENDSGATASHALYSSTRPYLRFSVDHGYQTCRFRALLLDASCLDVMYDSVEDKLPFDCGDLCRSRVLLLFTQ